MARSLRNSIGYHHGIVVTVNGENIELVDVTGNGKPIRALSFIGAL